MKKDLIRVAAKEKGEQYYVPEKPCVRGHYLRQTSDGACLSCRRIRDKNNYWKNPDKGRVKAKKYTAANKSLISAKNKKAWAEKSKDEHEAINAYRRKYYQKTIEARREEKRKYYEGIKKDPQRLLEKRIKVNARRKLVGRTFEKSNPEVKRKYRLSAKGRAANIRYDKSKLSRTPKWLSEEDNWLIEEIYALAILRTKLHGFSWHVDHIIPLQGKLVSGLHVPKNLQVIPWLDNIKKANKHLPV